MDRVALGMLVGSLVMASAALGGGCGSVDVQFAQGGGGGAGGNKTVGSTGGMTTGPATATSTTGTTTTSTTGITSTTGTTGTSSTTSTTSTTTTGPGPASSSSGGGCTADPQDTSCVACSKSSCCSTLVPCQNDPSCVCWTGCLPNNPNNPGACVMACGNYDATTQAFVNCAVQSCGTPCGGGSGTTGPASSSSSGGGACAPAMGDSACTTCSKNKCCSDVNACAADANCICWVTCLANGGTFQTCSQPQFCGGTGTVTNNLFGCSLSQCQGQCP